MNLREEVVSLIALLQTKDYDQEMTHVNYDRLLEEFILDNRSKQELPEIEELIQMKKDFWFA